MEAAQQQVSYGNPVQGERLARKSLTTDASNKAQQLYNGLIALHCNGEATDQDWVQEVITFWFSDKETESLPQDFVQTIRGVLKIIVEGDVDSAEPLLKKAVELNPSSSLCHCNLGWFTIGVLGDVEQAEAEYKKAIELDETNSYAHTNLGVILYTDKQQPDAAEKEYRTSLTHNSKCCYTHYSLGELLEQRQGDSNAQKEAEAQYKEALECYPDFHKAHYRLAYINHYKKENWDVAEKYYRETLRCEAAHVEAHLHFGKLRYSRGDIDAAEQSYRTALSHGLDPFVIINLAQLLAKDRQNLDGAEALFNTALEGDPPDAALHHAFGQFLYNHKKAFKKAEKELKRALQCEGGESCIVHLDLGILYQEHAGKPKEAKKEFETALRLDPNNLDAQARLWMVQNPGAKPKPKPKAIEKKA